MKTHLALLAVVVVFAAGCATTSEQVSSTQQTAQANDDIKCSRQLVTGSHMPTRRCTTRDQREKERREAEQAIQIINVPTATTPGN